MNLTVQVDRLELVNLRPDDILIVTLPAMATLEQMDHVKAKLAHDLPDITIIVKPNGIGFDFFHRDDLEPVR